jgi:HSP20 family protein
MLSIFNPFDELLRNDDLWGRAPVPAARAYAPAVDVVEEKDAFVLRAEMPGFKLEELDVAVDGNVLTLKGERRYAEDKEHKGYKRIERRYGSFRRAFTLPETIKADAIDATLDAGVLTVRIPKREEEQPRKVTVRAA